MKATSRTPSIEPSPRPGWEASVESVASETDPIQRQQTWLRRICLERDENRCVVSGYYDHLQWEKLCKDDTRLVSELNTRTQAAHIVPFCCGSFDKSGVSAFSQIQSLANWIVNKLKKASATWEALWRAFPLMQSQLLFGPGQINEPYNALTPDYCIHFEFRNYSIAFESTVSISSKSSAKN